MFKAFGKTLLDEDGPIEKWSPYFEEIANQTLKAAKTCDNIVITHATLRTTWRDFFMQKLEEGGILKENISMLYLTIEEDVKLEGLYYRTKRGAEATGKTLEEHLRLYHGWKGEGIISFTEYKLFCKTHGQFGSYVCQDPPPYAKVVDVTSRDEAATDAIEQALGLRKQTTDSYKCIVAKIAAIDNKRYLESAAAAVAANSESSDAEDLFDKLKLKDNNCSEQMAKRNSSLIVG